MFHLGSSSFPQWISILPDKGTPEIESLKSPCSKKCLGYRILPLLFALLQLGGIQFFRHLDRAHTGCLEDQINLLQCQMEELREEKPRQVDAD